MKKTHNILILAAFAALVFGGVLAGAERDRYERLRGTFVGLTEREVGERVCMGIVVKPLDWDGHVTVLIPWNNERLKQTAHELREGQRLGISFGTEDDFKWVREMEVERPREEIERRPEGERTVAIRRETRREPENIERQRPRREEQAFRPDPEVERERFRGREGREPRREPPYPERIDAQLREIVEGHMDRMRRVLREVFMAHIERTEAELRELRGHVENMEMQMRELRAENERLRMQLRERGGMQREEMELRERREPDRPREGRERQEREVQRDRDRRTDLDRPAEDRPREQREAPGDSNEGR
ncbi:MAG: hypothetical protein ABIF19_09565 [Planctomycetota bacterium]